MPAFDVFNNGFPKYTLLNIYFCFITEKMEAPVITQKPKKKDVKEGGKAKFEVKASGKPLPDIEW